jgi:predicted dinucleotide-binding enzyme
MTYSIIGSGNIGSALARQFARKGIPVAIANLRGPDSLQLLKKELGENIVPQTIEAALTANTIVLAAPFTSVSEIARNSRNWKAKIVVDATNAIDFPSYAPTDLGGRPSSELVEDQLRGARVV